MNDRTVIHIENVSKRYRLGQIGRGTFVEDVQRFGARVLGRPDPARSVHDNERERAGGSHVWALRNVDLEVKEGEVVGLIGRNGAGKSTLLKLLSRITLPTEGRIRARGRLASLLEVGTGFHPELTGRENVYLNGAILGMRREEVRRRLEEIVEFSGCAKYIDTPVKRYSSGMVVRLAFSVAAHLDCEILIVDEVLAVGDAEFQRKCIGKMRDVSSEGGRTVMFVSHNMASITSLCTRGLVMELGRIAFEGMPNDAVVEYERESQRLAATSLEDRKDRRGEGLIRFTDVEVFGVDGQGGRRPLVTGELAVIRLHFSAPPADTEVEARFSVFIAAAGNDLIALSSQYASDQSLRVREGGAVEFTIPRLPLSRGRYSLSLVVSALRTIHDNVEAAAYFEVLEGGFYPTRFTYDGRSEGRTVLVDHGFRLLSGGESR